MFGFDDSALKTAEKLSKLAAKHISEVKTKVNAAKNAIRNPEAARKLGVKVKKDAEKLLTDAQSEMQRWEHWYTDPELSAQLRREAGEETEASVSRIEGVDINAISGNIGKYFHDVKNAIRALYAKAFTHKGRNKSFVNFAQVNEEEQKMLSALCGEDFSGAEVHSIDEAGIRHMYNRHGKTEEKQDQSPLEESDFILIPEVVKDVVPKYLGKNRENNHVFQYHKKIGDEYFYLEEYRNGRGKLSGVSFWKKIGTPAAPTSKNVLDGKPTSETLRTRADKNTLHEETEKSSGEAKKIDKGRFNPESETPLLSSEEDANDFQLVGETAEDAKKADFAAEAEKKAKQARADAESKAATPDLIGEADTGAWGSKNKIVTTKVYEEQLAKLKKALNGRLHSGIDPEILSAGAVVAAYHIEAGARKFADFTSRMIEAAGENIRPYLKGLYESARRFPGMEKIAKEMDSTDFVDGYEFESNPAHLRSEIRDVIEADAESRVKGQRLKALAERHNLELKDVQEETEAVLVDMTREIDALGLSEDETFKRMAELYQKQPVLSNRTSTSIENQAYSTPVPLAWA